MINGISIKKLTKQLFFVSIIPPSDFPWKKGACKKLKGLDKTVVDYDVIRRIKSEMNSALKEGIDKWNKGRSKFARLRNPCINISVSEDKKSLYLKDTDFHIYAKFQKINGLADITED